MLRRTYAARSLIPAFWARRWRAHTSHRRIEMNPLPRMHSKLPVRGRHTGIWTQGCVVRFKHVGT